MRAVGKSPPGCWFKPSPVLVRRGQHGGALAYGIPIVAIAAVSLSLASGSSGTQAVAACVSAIALAVVTAGEGRTVAARMALIYVGAINVLGYLASISLTGYLNRREVDSLNWALQYSTVALVGILFFSLANRLRADYESVYSKRYEVWPFGLLLLSLMAAVGVVITLLAIPADYLSDPQRARHDIAASVSPTAQVLYKCIVTTAIVGGRYYAQSVARAKGLHYFAIGATGTALLSLYGGRFLGLALIVGMLVVWVRYQPVRWAYVVSFGLLVYVVASVVAAYRYYSLYSVELDLPRVLLTAVSQSSIEFLDGAAVGSSPVVDNSTAQQTLLRQALTSVPEVIAVPLGVPDYSEADFGFLTSSVLGQSGVGGIRVGLVGESLLAFGWYGAIGLGVILGSFCAGINSLIRRDDDLFLLGVIASLMLVSVVILGSGVVVSSLAVCGLARLAVRRK